MPTLKTNKKLIFEEVDTSVKFTDLNIGEMFVVNKDTDKIPSQFIYCKISNNENDNASFIRINDLKHTSLIYSLDKTDRVYRIEIIDIKIRII